MLTAGHCIPSGGHASWPSFTNEGNVTATNEENWSDTYGTQYFPLQSVYRGDLALVRLNSGVLSAPEIYVTAAHGNGSTGKYVEAINPTWSKKGDSICTSGKESGVVCWQVYEVGISITYGGLGSQEVVKHVDSALPEVDTQCIISGDSGGSVYHNLADGKVTAVGIISGKDSFLECRLFFTDVWDAYYGLPGTVLATG